MADSGSSHQANPAVAPCSRKSRGKKSLVHASVYSIRDLLNEFGEAFPNLLNLEASQFPSRYKQKHIELFSFWFGLNSPYRAVIPKPSDRSCNPRDNSIAVYKEAFYAGLRIPPSEFICRLLAEACISPSQLMPNGWRFITCFQVQCLKHKLTPSVAVFRYFFKFVNSPQDSGWVHIQYRKKGQTLFIPGTSPDSFPNWKVEWFWLELEG